MTDKQTGLPTAVVCGVGAEKGAERGFEFFEGRFVNFAREGNDVVNARGKGLTGARNGLAHAREKAASLRRFLFGG